MITTYLELKETASTNSYLAQVASLLPSGTVVHTQNQTSGRGQRGNNWESLPGVNLTFSLLLKDTTLAPNKQFYISEAVSIALINVLQRYADGFSIKWPNDIFFKDKKIGGILIENVISGESIVQSIIGIGLNVNQEKFFSEAPNPISLKHIIGTETDLTDLLHEIGDELSAQLTPLTKELEPEQLEELHASYLADLYWKDNAYHPFELPSGESFEAKIINVAPDGKMLLENEKGGEHSYYFKEVIFKI